MSRTTASPSASPKQAIVLRADLGMGKGKLVAHGLHAALEAYKNALRKDPSAVERWEREGSKKIVLRAESEGELLGLHEQAKRLKLPAGLVADAGRTQLEPGTLTALAIGPGPEELVDQVTGKLRLL